MKTIHGLIAGAILAAGLSPPALADPPDTAHHAPAKAETGPRNFSTEEITVEHGDISLAATVLLPEGAGPHPGIVVVPGSGPHPRAYARVYAEVFANSGFAVMAYDKRGSGESTGSWVSASLDDLAGDAWAAMRSLATHPGVDSERIGLWAPSQGAWVSSVMHSQGANIAFMAVMSGGGVTPRESETYSYEKALEHAGASEEEMGQAASLLDAYFDYLGSGAGRDALLARIEAVESEPWYTALNLGRVVPSEANRSNWAWVANYDPMPSIETMKFPVLLLFGALDQQQPTPLAVERWEQGLQRAGNRNWCTRVFPGANHFLRMAGEGGGHDAPLAEGFLDFTADWLGRVTRMDGRVATPAGC